MKTLVVFYSRTGITRKIAKDISKNLKCDIEEILEPSDRKGIKGYMISGFEAAKKKTPKILSLKKNPSDYERIIIGTPVWVGTMASPVRSFISEKKADMKDIAFFSTQGAKKSPKTFIEMEALIGKKPLCTADFCTKNIIKNDYNDKLDDFIKIMKR